MAHSTTVTVREVVAAERVAFAGAALAVAGHEVTDPVLRDLMWRVASGEMSGDEAIATMRQHIQG